MSNETNYMNIRCKEGDHYFGNVTYTNNSGHCSTLRYCLKCGLPEKPMSNEYDPHEVSKVKCDLCGHEWIAVRPEGLVKLECPNCNNLVSFENVEAQ